MPSMDVAGEQISVVFLLENTTTLAAEYLQISIAPGGLLPTLRTRSRKYEHLYNRRRIPKNLRDAISNLQKWQN
jgi:hypothetical protein